MPGTIETRIGEFLLQTVERRAAGRRLSGGVQGDELRGDEGRDSADQGLFGGKIVMQRRDVDAGTVRDAARPQPLEAVRRKTRERAPHQIVAPLIPAPPG